MKAVNQFIFNYLAKHENVSFPHLGTLEVVREDAKLNDSGELSFPVNRAVFTSAIHDEWDVVSKIEAESGLPEADIKYAYDRWVDSARECLAEGVFIIDGVCTITRVGDDEFEVSLFPELNKLLNPFDRKSVKLVRMGVNKGRSAKRNKKSVAWVFSLSALCVIAAAAYYFGIIVNRNPVPEIIPAIPKTELPAIVSGAADSLDSSAPVNDSVFVNDSLNKIMITPAADSAAPLSDTIYYIIAGVFSSEENAARFISGRKITDGEVVASRDKYMVSLARFESPDAAWDALSGFKAEYNGVWIYKRKNFR